MVGRYVKIFCHKNKELTYQTAATTFFFSPQISDLWKDIQMRKVVLKERLPSRLDSPSLLIPCYTFLFQMYRAEYPTQAEVQSAIRSTRSALEKCPDCS